MSRIIEPSENVEKAPSAAPLDTQAAAQLSFQLYLQDKAANRNELVRLIVMNPRAVGSPPVEFQQNTAFFWYNDPSTAARTGKFTPDMTYEAEEVLALIEGFEADYAKMKAAGVDTIEEVPGPQNCGLPSSVYPAEVAHIAAAAAELIQSFGILSGAAGAKSVRYEAMEQIFLSQINPATRLQVARPAAEAPSTALTVGQDVFFTVSHAGDIFQGTVAGTGPANTIILESVEMGRTQVPAANILGVAFPAAA